MAKDKKQWVFIVHPSIPDPNISIALINASLRILAHTQVSLTNGAEALGKPVNVRPLKLLE